MPDDSAPKRRYPRYSCMLDILIYLPGDVVQARVTMISRGGCLVLPVLPTLPTPSVKVSFRLQDDLPYINCKGEVVYSIPDKGTGIAFTEISQYNQDLISEFFDKKAAAEKPAGT